jgi:hypothetical protein
MIWERNRLADWRKHKKGITWTVSRYYNCDSKTNNEIFNPIYFHTTTITAKSNNQTCDTHNEVMSTAIYNTELTWTRHKRYAWVALKTVVRVKEKNAVATLTTDSVYNIDGIPRVKRFFGRNGGNSFNGIFGCDINNVRSSNIEKLRYTWNPVKLLERTRQLKPNERRSFGHAC